MAHSAASQLRHTLVEIDRRLLGLLLDQGHGDHDRGGKIALLKKARAAAQRLLMAADAEGSEADA